MTIWFTFSYAPICHMVWGGGLISDFGLRGALDFAGGTVVHINAGVAALVACIVLGPRKGIGKENMSPHNVPLVIIGASMLWVGWFGFNAGSELAADGTAGMALLVTHIATAVAAFSWMVIEWITKGKPTAVGLATGAVAGLVAITPASGFVGPLGALVIGVAAGLICYWASTVLKHKHGYDDSLDVFGVHGVGGIVGALLTGYLVQASWGGAGLQDPSNGVTTNTVAIQMKAQFMGIVVTIIWTAVVAWIALKIAGAVCGGIRTSEDDETEGLDVTDHGESGYTL
jgi:Amt family ammonium transporter